MKIGTTTRNQYPIGIIVDIHDYCNATCKMCPYELLREKLNQGNMDWKLYTKIVDDFSYLIDRYKFKGMMTYCNMGEPFIKENLHEYTSYAEEKGIIVYLNTNASLMTPSKIDNLLKSGYCGSINISFHGATKNVYKNIMGLNQNTTLKNIKYLISKYDKEKISVNAINYFWPAGEEAKIKSLFTDLNVNIAFSKPISRGGLIKIYRKPIRYKIAGCGPERVFYQMVISHNGDALLCCNDMARKEIVGNLVKNDIHQIWNGEVFQNYLKKIYLGNYTSKQFICNSCDESVPYWSFRRFIKAVLPKKIICLISNQKAKKWALSKNITK